MINQFKPNLSPYQVMALGSFGGTYWRPIDSRITSRTHRGRHKKYRWDLPDEILASQEYDKEINCYGVRVGESLEYWEDKGWITKHDPYGWFQWYCNYCDGRRIPEEDERQIKRWLGVAGPKGRFRRRLINMIREQNGKYNDKSISPKIRQTLQHWGYELTDRDFKSAYSKKGSR